MPLRFAFSRPDGGVSIVNAAPFETLAIELGTYVEVVTDKGDLLSSSHFLWSRDAYRAHVLALAIPSDATSVIDLPDDWTPPDDRTFRDAWAFDGKAVKVDMPKARNIHRDRLRAARRPKLEALDTEYQRADEAGDAKAKAAIAERKQELRDVTADPAIEAAQTPAELAAVRPAILA